MSNQHEQPEDRCGGIEVTALYYMPPHEKIKVWLRVEAERKIMEKLLQDEQYLATHPKEEKDPIQYIELPD